MIVQCTDCVAWVQSFITCNVCQEDQDLGECRMEPPKSSEGIRIHTPASFGCIQGVRKKGEKGKKG